MTDVNQLITTHLDIWTSATQMKASVGRGNNGPISLYGITKLRDLILELAVRGKLVEQHDSEGQATKLLTSYGKSRNAGIKEKQFRKQNLGPQLDSSEALFELPRNWCWARLGDIGFIYHGNSVSAKAKSEKYSAPHGLPFVATKNVGYGFEPIDYNVDAWIPEGEPNFKIAGPSTPLICSEGGSAGKKCGLTDRAVYFGNKLFACQFYGDFHPKFLVAFYQTPSFYSQFSENMTGIIGGISLAKFLRLGIPVPPIAEQNRIVAKVDELMELCDALEYQAADSLKAHQSLVETCLTTLTRSQTAGELTQNWTRIETHFDTLFTTEESIQSLRGTIMQLAVQGLLIPNTGSVIQSVQKMRSELAQLQEKQEIKPGKRGKGMSGDMHLAPLPVSWKRIDLQDLAVQITDGTHLTPKYTANGRPFLSAKNVKPFQFLPDEHRFVSEDDFEGYRSNRKPVKGDLLVTRVGAGIGEAAIIDTDMEFAIYVSVCLIKPFSKYLNPDYLCLWLNSPEGRNLMTKKTYGRGASQGNLNLEFIRTLPVPVPSIDEQVEIVKAAKSFFEVCNELSILIEKRNVLAVNSADILTSKIH